MENLIFCLNATVPIFLLMLLGLFFRKINLFDDAFVSKANKFVSTVTLPVLIFKDLATADFASSWDTPFVIFCFLATAISIFIAFLLSIPFRKSCSQGEFIQASYRSSAVILGIALIQNIYGNSGMAPLMIIGSVPLYNIMAVVVLEIFKPQTSTINKNMTIHALKGIVTNPIIFSIVIGIIWSLLKIPMPDMLGKTVTHIANLATPLGLMAMGATFSMQKSLENLKPTLLCTFMKLVGFASIFLPIALHLGFRDSQLIAILVMLSSATTVSSFVMAKNMGHEGSLSSSVIMLTTCLSAFTLTVWLFILRTGGFI